jgi:hypothetical protein
MNKQVTVWIARFAYFDKRSVNGDHIGLCIDARAQLAHDSPVDGDSSRHNHVLGWS